MPFFASSHALVHHPQPLSNTRLSTSHAGSLFAARSYLQRCQCLPYVLVSQGVCSTARAFHGVFSSVTSHDAYADYDRADVVTAHVVLFPLRLSTLHTTYIPFLPRVSFAFPIHPSFYPPSRRRSEVQGGQRD